MVSNQEDTQTIPARHGTATFVPKGSTIKIINTSGSQVIDTWAFALPSPPKKKDLLAEQQKAKDAEAKDGNDNNDNDNKKPEELEKESKLKEDMKKEEDERKKAEGEEKKAKKPPSSPSSKRKSKGGGLDLPSQEEAEKATAAQVQEEEANNKQQQTPTKAGWSSYLPSLRGRNKQQQQQQITDGNDKKDEKKDSDDKKKKDKENSKTWGSYLQYGQGVTSYLPSKGAISAFATQHARDPSKGIAEQLADFSRTPVGAASLSVLTGSGTAGSLYAGYSAWNSLNGENAQSEFLSMAHTRAATCHIIPRVNDVLVSNLRQPMLTVLEDTSGVHDTLIPACDPQRYRGFGVEDWEQHGSCAENLVLALKELNERAGLKGPKGVGASVTVNSVPAPLNLFMNIPWTGDKGDLSFEKPRSKEGDYVVFKAERDVVVIMSACPNDVQDINNKQIKDAHFVVEHPEDSEDEAAEEKKAEEKKPEPKKKPRKLNSGKKDDTLAKKDDASAEKDATPAKKDKESKKDESKKDESKKDESKKDESKKDESKKDESKKEESKKDDKPEEQKKAEKTPLPSTPSSEKPEPTTAPAPPAPSVQKSKSKPEEQKKAEKVPLPSTPSSEKPDPTAPASSTSAASKPKAKPKKLVDSSTGERKKPRKLQPKGSTAAPTSGSQTTKEGEGESAGDKSGKNGGQGKEAKDSIMDRGGDDFKGGVEGERVEEKVNVSDVERGDEISSVLGSLIKGGLRMFALGAQSPVGLMLQHLDEMKQESQEREIDDI